MHPSHTLGHATPIFGFENRAYGAFYLTWKFEFRIRMKSHSSWQCSSFNLKNKMDVSIVAVSTVSPNLHRTLHYALVCTWMHKVVQYCLHTFPWHRKQSKWLNNRCTAQLSLSVDKTRSHTEIWTWDRRGSSDLTTRNSDFRGVFLMT